MIGIAILCEHLPLRYLCTFASLREIFLLFLQRLLRANKTRSNHENEMDRTRNVFDRNNG